MCAAARAHHLLFDQDPVFHDDYGAVLTSDWWKRVLRVPVLRRVVMEWLLRPARPGAASVIGRARYLEDQVEPALDRGVTQYVIVGAGMDSFAARRPDLRDRLRIIELDHPNTQRVKRMRLGPGHAFGDRVAYVPIDFEQEDIAYALQRSTFDPTQKTLFSWMGVSHYLPKPVVYDALESMRAAAPAGCEVIFDYHTHRKRTVDTLPQKFLRVLTRSVGERQISAFDDAEVERILRERGLDTVDLITGDRMNAQYFMGRHDGLRALGHVRVAHLRSDGSGRAHGALS